MKQNIQVVSNGMAQYPSTSSHSSTQSNYKKGYYQYDDPYTENPQDDSTPPHLYFATPYSSAMIEKEEIDDQPICEVEENEDSEQTPDIESDPCNFNSVPIFCHSTCSRSFFFYQRNFNLS